MATRASETRARSASGGTPTPPINSKRAVFSATPLKSIKKIAATEEHLEDLEAVAADRAELLRVTSEYVEGQRRLTDDEQRRARLERLQEDDRMTECKFTEIAAQWNTALSHTDAADLKQALDMLRTECSAVLAQKSALVEEFKAEIKGKDDLFVKTLRTQSQDVQAMLDYVADHSKSLWGEYRQQLEGLEAAFMAERAELLQAAHKVAVPRCWLA